MSELIFIFELIGYAALGMFIIYLVTEVSEARQQMDVTIYEFLIIIVKSIIYALFWPVLALEIVMREMPDMVLFKKRRPQMAKQNNLNKLQGGE